MRSFILYLGYGKVYKKTSLDAVDFMVTGFPDIIDKVLAFRKHPATLSEGGRLDDSLKSSSRLF